MMPKLVIVGLLVLMLGACAKAPEAKVEYFTEGQVWFYKVSGQWQPTEAVVRVVHLDVASINTRQILLLSGNSVLCADAPKYDGDVVRCTPKHFSLGEKTWEAFRVNGQWVSADGKKL